MDHAQYFRRQLQVYPISDEGDPQSGSSHLHYRVSVPTLRAIVKSWTQDQGNSLTFDDWTATLDSLYHGESIEERSIAGMLLAQFKKHRERLSLDTLDSWMDQLEGWKEVDSTCQSAFTAPELLARWSEWDSYLERLTSDPNINKRRASLVLLVKPIRDSGDLRLWGRVAVNVERLTHETDKLITKAISWVLREATKSNHVRVAKFVDDHTHALPALVIREVRKKLTTGKK
jgi:3-methyladenine DNA glycosylase AlkD